jgi:hypothetical protein
MARYRLMKHGVFDTQRGAQVTPADPDHWKEVEDWVSQGNIPDPIPPEPVQVPQFNFKAAGKARMARAIERLAEKDPTQAMLAQGGFVNVEPDTV